MKRWDARPGLAHPLGAVDGDTPGDEPSGTADAGDTGDTGDADYAFEGYSVELLDKVVLMPIVPAAPRT